MDKEGYKMSGAAGKRCNITSRSGGLMSSLEELLNKENLLDEEEIVKVPLEKKFEILVQAILNVNNKFSTVHEMFNEANDRIDPRTNRLRRKDCYPSRRK